MASLLSTVSQIAVPDFREPVLSLEMGVTVLWGAFDSLS